MTIVCPCGLLTHRTGFRRLCDGCNDQPVLCRCPRVLTHQPAWLARKAAGQLPAKELVA